MTFRAVATGILFALFISVVVYFNDHIVQQTYLIGNHFPIIVFGVSILLVLFINPLIGRLFPRGRFSRHEIAVMTALGLAACGWPGSGFFRYFTALVTMPSNSIRTNASWQAERLLSYVPGASFQIAPGHVGDWQRLCAELAQAPADSTRRSPKRRVWEMLPSTARTVALSVAAGAPAGAAERTVLLTALNRILADTSLYRADYFADIAIPARTAAMIENLKDHAASPRAVEEVNRYLLCAAFNGVIAPPPPGGGILLADGDIQSPAVTPLFEGKKNNKRIGLFDIPWAVWRPTLFLWGGLAVLMGVASVCLVLILQPQWKRELVPYPIANFITELTRSDREGGAPAVCRNRLFWYAFTAMIVLHLVNGCAVWFPDSITIPQQLDFSALQQLFPRARQAWCSFLIWSPRIFPTVIAFAFFVSTEVSFSLGMSGFLYLAATAFMISMGVTMQREWLDAENENLLRIGAYIGMAVILAYVGRRYYWSVVRHSLWPAGRATATAETPAASAVWAARIIYLCIAASAWMLSRCGVAWFFSVPLMIGAGIMLIVLTRMNVETGAFFIQPLWMPLGILTTMFGLQALGPTGYIVTAMFCLILLCDPREVVMPFVANAMYLAEGESRDGLPVRTGVLFALVVAGAFGAALAATLYFQYNAGMNFWDSWAIRYVPEMPFNRLALHVSHLSAYGELSRAAMARGAERLALIRPDTAGFLWIGAGCALVLLVSMLRLRFSWWPLHPVAFIVWGTFAGLYFAPSFFIGWIVKTLTLKLGGSRAVRSLKPFMVGIIGGEIFAAISWSIFGAMYHIFTGLIPHSYKIFPD